MENVIFWMFGDAKSKETRYRYSTIIGTGL